MADFRGDFFDRRRAIGQRRHEFRVAVALQNLVRDRRRLQPQFAADVTLDECPRMRENSHRAADFPDGDRLARAAQALFLAAEFLAPEEALDAKGQRFGVHSVRAAHH